MLVVLLSLSCPVHHVLPRLPHALQQYASAEVDRAQARARGNIDNPLGACYAVPVSSTDKGLASRTGGAQQPDRYGVT